MKFKLTFSIVLSLILLSACKKEGGSCEYTTIQKEVTATFIDGELDREFTVSFQPIGSNTDEVYRITSAQFKTLMRNFDLEALRNKDAHFTLKMDEITKGACVPFLIKEIRLE